LSVHSAAFVAGEDALIIGERGVTLRRTGMGGGDVQASVRTILVQGSE